MLPLSNEQTHVYIVIKWLFKNCGYIFYHNLSGIHFSELQCCVDRFGCVPRVKCHNMDTLRDCPIDRKVSKRMVQVSPLWRYWWRPLRVRLSKWQYLLLILYLLLNRRYFGWKVRCTFIYYTTFLFLFFLKCLNIELWKTSIGLAKSLIDPW